MNELIIPEYTKEDYLLSTSPFEWLYQYKDNKLKMKQVMTLMSERATAAGVKNFVTLFKMYIESVNAKSGNVIAENSTDFEGQEIQLDCGDWYADDFGITTTDKFGFEIVACNHPIMPVQRLVNIDTGIEKLKIVYKKGRAWRSLIADKKTLASNNSILQLADFGVAVNSENAKYLVKYLTEIEHLNYDRIEELNSVSRLGWIDDYGFSPYVENLIFDGDVSFKNYFESVRQKGTFDKWLEIARDVRQGNSIPARIMLASSFASALVEPLGALPFFVHIWGTTESGKTVALMLAASVWANPKMGEYIHTFNSTTVAQELSASFVNSMPLILDELQIVKDRKDFDNLIYMLTEGVGKNRGHKTGGLQKVNTWQNCILTSGESPINNPASGGGAINRIVEVECNNEPLFSNPVRVAETLKHNFGYAGKQFVETLKETGFDNAKTIQKAYIAELSKSEATDKQSISASIILTADKLITDMFFKDGKQLVVNDIKSFLSTKTEVSHNERAYNYLNDYIAMNSNKFRIDNDYDTIWGCQDDDYTYIIKSQFDWIMSEGGYNAQSVLSWLGRTDKIKKSQGKNTVTKRILGNVCRCVCIVKDEEVNDEEPDFMPFVTPKN